MVWKGVKRIPAQVDWCGLRIYYQKVGISYLRTSAQSLEYQWSTLEDNPLSLQKPRERQCIHFPFSLLPSSFLCKPTQVRASFGDRQRKWPKKATPKDTQQLHPHLGKTPWKIDPFTHQELPSRLAHLPMGEWEQQKTGFKKHPFYLQN